MRLIGAELRKLGQNRTVLLGLVMVLAANFFLLWSINARSGITAESYRNAAGLLVEMSSEEQSAYLKEHVQKLQTMYQMDNIHASLAQGERLQAFSKETQLFYQEHLEEYLTGDYLDCSTRIPEELHLCRLLLLEAQEVQKYPLILQQIQADADQILSISIFQKDAYRTAETKAAAEAFAGMEAAKIHYYPAIGLMRAINQNATDFLLLGCMLVLSLGLIRADLDSGLIVFLQTYRNGKVATAAAKILAFCLALLVAVLLLYGENLLYCEAVYGLGPLSRSIQSLPAFSHCTLQISAGEYLVLFLLIKWAAACITGLFAMVICLMAKQAYAGYVATILFWLGFTLVRTAIPATDRLNLFKYTNPISFLQTNELLGIWKSVYWFGTPLPRHLVEAAAAIFLFTVCCLTFTVIFCRKHFVQSDSSVSVWKHSRRPVKVRPIWWQECYKALILQGAALVLSVFLVVQITDVVQKEIYLPPEELCYQKYMTEISGPWNRSAYQSWQEMKAKAWPEQTEDSNYLLQDVLQYRVYPQIQKVSDSQKTKRPTQLVYASSYLEMLAFDDPAEKMLYPSRPGADTQRMSWNILCAMLTTIVCVGIFSLETNTRMESLLGSTRYGRRRLAQVKLTLATILAALVGYSVWLPQFFRVLYWFGFPAWNAPAESIYVYAEAPVARWPLWALLVVDLAGVLFACMGMACIVCWMAHRIQSIPVVIAGVSVIFALPPLLGRIGIRQFCPLSLFPLFHAGVQLQSGSRIVWMLAILWVYGVLVWLCATDLMDSFGTK